MAFAMIKVKLNHRLVKNNLKRIHGAFHDGCGFSPHLVASQW